MKIYAAGRNVATHTSKKQIKTIITPLRTLIKCPMHIYICVDVDCLRVFSRVKDLKQWARVEQLVRRSCYICRQVGTGSRGHWKTCVDYKVK